jgi:protease secretion system membrane fusion protein
MNIIKKADAPIEVLSHDVSPLTVNTDASAYARIGWIIVLVGVLGFLVWAVLAPLDKGVAVQGTVTKESNRKTVQYLQAGIVQDILVKDGDHVKAGQVLVKMNNVQAQSAQDSVLAQYVTARVAEARLGAELIGNKSFKLPAALEPFKDNPLVTGSMALQNQLLTTRQATLQSEIAGMDENIAGVQAQIAGLQDSLRNKKEQQSILKEQLDNTRDLAKEGYIARNRLLDLERTYSQINGAISEDVGNIGRSQRQIMEVRLRKAQRTNEYQKEVRSQFSDLQREAAALEGRLDGLTFELANTEVRSPADGIVVGTSIFTRGGVVTPGSRMMEIVPTDDALVVEGPLPVNLIDKISVGLKVDLVFSAFNANKTPHIEGEVIQVAADRALDERTGQPYYKVRARVTPAGLKLMTAKKLDVVPGMPVEMFVKTGERTMMSYLLKPLLDRAKSSMTEE